MLLQILFRISTSLSELQMNFCRDPRIEMLITMVQGTIFSVAMVRYCFNPVRLKDPLNLTITILIKLLTTLLVLLIDDEV